MRKKIIYGTFFVCAIILLGGCEKKIVNPGLTPTASASPTITPTNSPSPSPTPAFFTESLLDPVLAKYVKSELGMAESEELTQEIIDTVTDITLEEDISTLSGLEFFHNLTTFGGRGHVTDISAISKLTNLQFFGFGLGVNMEIPDLSNNTNLSMLSLCACGVKDVSKLMTAPNLTQVYLSDNFIASIDCLKGMRNIEMLDLTGNPVLDYGAIKDDENLVKAIEAVYYGYYDYKVILEIENRARKIVRELITDDMPTLQKEYLIYEYVMKNMEYCEVEGYVPPFAYDGIILGKGVCVAFADFLTLLLRTAGIEAMRVTSDTHAWTLVNVDGIWYHCDATWDDSFVDCELSYFNLGSEIILDDLSHIYDTARYPETSKTDMPYEKYMEYLSENRKKP